MPAMRHLIVPGIIAVFSVVVIWVASQLQLSPPMIVGHSMQPRSFPIFLMVINLLLCGMLAVQYWRSPPAKVPFDGARTWASMALFALFYAITVYVDMLIAVAVVMFLMCLVWGERRWYVAVVISLVTPAAIFMLFDSVLKVRFPRGLLTNWIYG